MPSRLSSSVAGVVSFSPLSAMRPSAIMRSISRRDASPARARSLATRCEPSSRADGAADVGRRSPRGRCGTGLRLVRCGRRVIGVKMLFGKRKQVVKRILIVEDEPLTAFDIFFFKQKTAYEIVATIDQFD